jgi:hypothetical protein
MGAPIGIAGSTGRNPSASACSCACFAFQEREQHGGRLAVRGVDQSASSTLNGCSDQNVPLDGIDRDERHRRLPAVRLAHQVLVQHRRRQVAGTALDHLVGEEAGRLAVVHDRFSHPAPAATATASNSAIAAA